MSTAPQILQEKSVSTLARVAPDRRRHRRVELSLLGRFMRENREEHHCRLVDISLGGASLQGPLTVEQGETIVVYFDELGRLEGTVVRRMEDGFAMMFKATPRKREKLAEQLTWLINRNILGLPDERRHERVIPAKREIALNLPNGGKVMCVIIDVSVGGASLETDARPELGTEIVLGRLRGRIVRHHDAGVGIEFTDIQNQASLSRHFD
ncbi:MAG: PilZ domain-containing protein [Hyphomicrobiaceae bacterium]